MESVEIKPLRVRGHEAARMLGISDSTLKRLVDSGQIPKPKKEGRCVFYLVSDLEAYVKNGTPSEG
jgi:excisionase family DNA binding protein